VLLTDLTKYFAQATFIASLLFALVYQLLKFRWWETVTGRATITLDLSIAGALLHTVLVIWGLPTVTLTKRAVSFGPWYDEILTWVSVISLGTAGLAIFLLCWQAFRYSYAETGTRTTLANRLLMLRHGQR
jgi:hypothetical protein